MRIDIAFTGSHDIQSRLIWFDTVPQRYFNKYHGWCDFDCQGKRVSISCSMIHILIDMISLITDLIHHGIVMVTARLKKLKQNSTIFLGRNKEKGKKTKIKTKAKQYNF